MAPLPKDKIIPICILLFCEAFNGNSIFTYVGNMVYDLGVANDKETVGYYAGLIGSCWFFAQFLSSFFWGKMSDIFGRRPIMIFGVLGSLLSSIAFGFSFNLPFAVFSRSMNGLLNGNIGVVKTYIAEVTDSSNQSRAFGLIGLMWGAGGIVGAMVGGLLSRPAINYPSIFSSTGIFAKFPYLLPNLAVASASLTGFIAAIIFLKENELKYEELNTTELEDGLEQSIESEDLHQKLTVNGTPRSSSSSDLLRDDVQDSLLTEDEKTSSSNDHNLISTNGSKEVLLDQDSNPNQKSFKFFSFLKLKRRKIPKGKGLAILKDKYVLMTVFMYALVGFYNTIYDEVTPLYAFAEISSGGLGFTTPNIGVANMVGACSIIVFQTFVYRRVVDRLKLMRSFLLGQLCIVPIMILVPSVTYLSKFGKPVVWTVLLTLYILRFFATQLVFSPVMAMINNSAEFTDLGAVNGLGQSLVALFRAIGPACGGSILAWSYASGYPFPLNHYFVYLICCLISIIPTIMVLYLPKSLNLPINEVNKNKGGGHAMIGE